MRQNASIPAKARRRAPGNFYLFAWTAMGAISLAYLTFAISVPDMVAEVLPVSGRTSAEMAQTERATQALAEELAGLRREMSGLQQNVDSFRTEAATRDTQDLLAARIVSLEERLAKVQAAGELAALRNAAPRPGDRAHAAAQGPAPEQPVLRGAAAAADGPETPRSATQAAAAKAPKAVSIATGSVPAHQAAPPFGPAKVTAVRGPVGLELTNADSIDALRQSWSTLAAQNAGMLGKLAPRYRLSTDLNAQPFTLVAGPVANTADANRICAALRAKGVGCRIGSYSGEGL